jgi:hypothetical protein
LRISNMANVSRVVENGCRICEPSQVKAHSYWANSKIVWILHKLNFVCRYCAICPFINWFLSRYQRGVYPIEDFHA